MDAFAEVSATDTHHRFSQEQLFTLKIVTGIAASASTIGSGFIVFSFLIFPRLRTLAFQLILMLSIADLIQSILSLVNSSLPLSYSTSGHTVCYITSTIRQFSALSSVLWAACIAVHIYGAIVARWSTSTIKHLFWIYHSCAWGFPIVTIILGFSMKVFGEAGMWCWIEVHHPYARLFFYFLPLFTVMVALVFLLVKAHSSLNVLPAGKKVVHRLALYLLVFILCHFFSVLNRVHNFIVPHKPNFILYLLQSVSEPCMGFANAFVFGYTAKVKNEYSESRFFKVISTPPYQ